MVNNNLEIKISKNPIEYEEALNFMKNRVENIHTLKNKELLWFLNHDHIYTCGTSSNSKDILNNDNKILVKKTNRGGKITYHGPGQRIVYLMIDLNKRKKDVRKFIDLIELTLILLLREFEIESKSFPDRVGVWVTKVRGKNLPKEEKIAAIGLRIKKWITYHGISFNLNPDLSYYKSINPCGLENSSVTSLKKIGINLKINEFDKLFLKYFKEQLNIFI